MSPTRDDLILFRDSGDQVNIERVHTMLAYMMLEADRWKVSNFRDNDIPVARKPPFLIQSNSKYYICSSSIPMSSLLDRWGAANMLMAQDKTSVIHVPSRLSHMCPVCGQMRTAAIEIT